MYFCIGFKQINKMQKKKIMAICMLLMSGCVMAQEPMHKSKPVTYEQVTKMMVKDLKLDEKQQKKVTKLNKKYKTLIEGEQREAPGNNRFKMGERPAGAPPSGGMPGGQGGFGGGLPDGGFGGGMPGGGMGRGPIGGGMPGGPSSENSDDYDKKQKKYDKALGKILNEKQMEGYQEIKPQFASQRRVRDFLFGMPQDFNSNGKDK